MINTREKKKGRKKDKRNIRRTGWIRMKCTRTFVENRTTCWMDLEPFIRKRDVSLKSEIFFFRVVSARWSRRRGVVARGEGGEERVKKRHRHLRLSSRVWITCECCRTRALHRAPHSYRVFTKVLRQLWQKLAIALPFYRVASYSQPRFRLKAWSLMDSDKRVSGTRVASKRVSTACSASSPNVYVTINES